MIPPSPFRAKLTEYLLYLGLLLLGGALVLGVVFEYLSLIETVVSRIL